MPDSLLLDRPCYLVCRVHSHTSHTEIRIMRALNEISILVSEITVINIQEELKGDT